MGVVLIWKIIFLSQDELMWKTPCWKERVEDDLATGSTDCALCFLYSALFEKVTALGARAIWHFSRLQSMLHSFHISQFPRWPTPSNRTCLTYSGKAGNF